MDYFSIQEVTALGKVLDLNVGNMQHFYEQWGPSASTCIKLSQNPVDEATHEDNVKHAAAEFVKIAPTTFTSINAIMSPLLSIQPKGKDGSGRKIPVAYMATDQIKTIISYAAADAKARVQSKFFFKLSKQPGFQASMDQMFKTFVTISDKHSANEEDFTTIKKNIPHHIAKSRGHWCHVFITDNNDTAASLKYQALKTLPKNIHIYTGVFEFGQSGITHKHLKAFNEIKGINSNMAKEIVDVD
ncbi:hypothetical protein V8E53_006439 [Lactarius tabidus]